MQKEELNIEALQAIFADDTLYLIPEEKAGEQRNTITTPATDVVEKKLDSSVTHISAETQPTEIKSNTVPTSTALETSTTSQPVEKVKDKCTLLIFSEPTSASQKEMLGKMVAALNLLPTDIRFFEFKTGQNIPLERINKSFDYEKVLSFKISISELNAAPYQIVQINNRRYLLADELGLVENDVTLKKQLWAAIQKL